MFLFFLFPSYINLVGDIININLNQINISYEKIGNGYPIILLHGWGANKNTFNKLANNLKDNFTLYLIDLPGFGESEIGLPLNLYDVVDVIHQFVQNLNIDNPIIIGHSYGTRLAIIYSALYPVKKLVLISAAGIKEKLSFKKRMNIKIYKMLKKMNINIKMGSRDYMDADNVKRKMLVDAVNTDLTKEMNEINTECILLYGNKDETTPITLGKKIEAKIKNSRLIEIENAGHFPYLEQPSVFNLILSSFLIGDNK